MAERNLSAPPTRSDAAAGPKQLSLKRKLRVDFHRAQSRIGHRSQRPVFGAGRREEAATAQSVQYIHTAEDFDRIVFEDGMAAVEVPVELLGHIRFKNDLRLDSPRLEAVERSIRDRGFVPTDPIIARIGQKGRWVIVDGGHRLTAARSVSEEFWTNMLGPKVRTLYFLLFETDRSWAKVKDRLEAAEPSGLAEPSRPAPAREGPADA